MENLDEEEINKFEASAGEWWDEEGKFKSLHQINPLRVKFISEIVALQGKKVLDVGCGGGILSEAISKLGAEVIGIDLSEKTVLSAKIHGKKVGSKVTYLKSSTEQLLKEGKYKDFDVITCLELLEHIPDPSKIIQDCSRLLKRGGDIFLSTINRNLKSYLFSVIGAEYVLQLLPKGTHDYSKFIKPSEIMGWVGSNKLRLLKTVGLSYNPLTDHYYLSQDIKVNYMMHVKDG